MKALDIVRTPKGGIAFVAETNNNGKQASIIFIGDLNVGLEHNAWWGESQLEVIDSIPRMLANAMAHPFGKGQEDVREFFGLHKGRYYNGDSSEVPAKEATLAACKHDWQRKDYEDGDYAMQCTICKTIR